MKRFFKRLSIIPSMALAASSWGGVDLVISDATVDAESYAPGDAATITVTVENIGDADMSAGSNLEVVMTSDGGLANTGGITTVTSNAAIVAGETLEYTFSIVIEEADNNGTYLLSFEVDPNLPDVVEDNDGNNAGNNIASIVVDANPDMQISSVTVDPEAAYPGDTVDIEIFYTNAGNRATQSDFNIAVEVFDPDGASVGTGNQNIATGFAADDTGDTTISVNLPYDIPNGTYSVEVVIDSADTIPEGDGETNNESSASFTIDTVPDLTITDLQYDTGTWIAGDLINFTIEITNQQTKTDGNNTLRVESGQEYEIEVVLSTDNVFGNSDDFLLYQETVAGNRAGGNLVPDGGGVNDTFQISWDQAMPRNFFGDYFVLAKVDVNEQIDEDVEEDPSDNGNNVWYSTQTAKISIVPSANPEPTTFRASVASDGTEGDGLSEKPSLSSDGRYVAFSTLSKLDAADTDEFFDIYRRDNLTGEVVLVSKSLALGTSDGDSINPVISSTGQYVVFASESSNLIAGDTNGHRDIFRANMTSGLVELVSRATGAGGEIPDSGSALPDISDDGTLVVFQSTASNLTADILNASLNVFVRDMDNDTTTLLSLADGGASGGDSDSFEPKISGDGAYVVFTSEATDLVGGGTANQNVFRVQADASNMLLVSEDGGGIEGDNDSFEADLSQDGSIVVYATLATNLDDPGADVDGLAEIIVAEIVANSVNTVTRLLGSDGVSQFNDPSGIINPAITGARQPTVSADGTRIAFRTQSNNLLATSLTRSDGAPWTFNADPDTDTAVGYQDLNTTNVFAAAVSDIYLYDSDSGEYSLVTVNRFGYQGARIILTNEADESTPNIPSARDAVISANGRYVAFSSDGRDAYGFAHDRTNRISPDDNEVRDVFIHDFRTTEGITVSNPPTVSIDSPASPSTADVGETVVVSISASDPIAGDYVEELAIYINGAFIETLDGADFYQWTPSTPGFYLIQVIATDNDGFSVASSPLEVTVSDVGAPTVVINSPTGAVTAGIEQTFAATPTAAGSAITSVEFFVDGISIGSDTTSPYSVSWTPAGPGTYSLVAVATDAAGKSGASIVSSITASSASAPTIGGLSPVTGSSLVIGVAQTISVTASDTDGLASVEFFINGSSIGQASETTSVGTFQLDYTASLQGSLAFEAVATDILGNQSSVTATYTGSIGASPTVTLTGPDTTDTTPADGTADNALVSGEAVTLSATASDTDGSIASVVFTLNGSPIGTATFNAVSGAYELSYTPDFTGTVTIAAVATDDTGNTSSDSLGYVVSTGASPSVSISSPTTGSNVPVNTPVDLTATATDADGLIQSVEFFVNGASVGTGSESGSVSTFVLSWTPALTGSYSVTAVAIDDDGNQTTSTAITLIGAGGTAPTIGGLSPVTGSSLVIGVAQTISVTASDTDGLASVEFFINGSSIGQASETTSVGTFQLDYTASLQGSLAFEAVATDILGNQSSVTATYTGSIGASPTVTLTGPDTTDTTPADGTADNALTRGERVTIEVDVSEGDAAITSVEVFIDSNSIGFATLNQITGYYSILYVPTEAGTIEVSATATDALGNSASDSLDYAVDASTGPTVSLTSPDPTDTTPADGVLDTTIGYGIEQTIAATVVPNTTTNRPITQVEFFIDGSSIGVDTTAPYSTTWTAAGPGQYELEVIADDLLGLQGSSGVVRVEAVEPSAPTVTLVEPDTTDLDTNNIADTTLARGAPITLSANVSGGHSAIQSVQFFANGSSIGNGSLNSSNGRYETTYAPPSLGVVTISVVATDVLSLSDQDAFDFEVVASSGPTVTIVAPDPADTAPADGIADQTVSEGQSTRLEADTTDGDAPVTGVEFFVEGVSIGQGSIDIGSGNYFLNYAPDFTGVFTLTAVATDSFGNTGVDSVDYESIGVDVSDIEVREITLPETTFYPGITIPVQVTMVNNGPDAIATDFDITVTIDPPESGTGASATATVNASASPIANGTVFTETINITVPLDNPNGTFDVTAEADVNNDISEGGNEENNSAEATFSIAGIQPDLAVFDIDHDTGTWEAGDMVGFTLNFGLTSTINSIGTLRLLSRESFEVRVVLSTDEVYGNEDDFLLFAERVFGNGSGGNLLPGDVLTRTWYQAMPRNFFGDYFVLGAIDVKSEIAEVHEDDDAFINGNNIFYPFETAKISIVPSEDPQATTFRASIREDGSEGSGLSEDPALSEDGRYVAFASLSQLVDEDTDSFYDIYRRDNWTGAVKLMSRSGSFSRPDGDSQFPSISANGRFVVFASVSGNLTPADTNGHSDIFIADAKTGTVTSVTPGANGSSSLPSLSADGLTVVFQSTATNLTSDSVTTGRLHVYAYSFLSDSMTLLSLASGGGQANGNSWEPKVSGNGQFVAFSSDATNIVAGTSMTNVYRVSISGTNPILVSQDGANNEGDMDSSSPAIDADGSTIVYSTWATNIDTPVGGDTDGLAEIVIADIAGASVTPTRILSASGTQFNDSGNESASIVGALSPSISADGQRIVFRTQSNNILPVTYTSSDGFVWVESTHGTALGYSDTNSTSLSQEAVSDIYLYDRNSDTLEIATLNRFGYQAPVFFVSLDGNTYSPNVPSSRDGVISPNGRFVAFSSDGRHAFGFDHERTNQLSSDANEVRDVFIRDFRTTGEPVEIDPPTVSVDLPLDGAIVVQGKTTVITVTATDVAPGYIDQLDLFINGIRVDTQNTSGFFFQWTPDTTGEFEIYALATDNDGITVASETVDVTVSPSTAPTVSLVYPANGQSFWTSQSINMSAVAWDDDGSITQVEFYVDGQLIGVDQAAPYFVSWSPDAKGNFSLAAVAVDNTGLKGISTVNEVVVRDIDEPTVTVTVPSDGATLTTGETITLTASVVFAGVNDLGTITDVDFYVNGVLFSNAVSVNGSWTRQYAPQGLGRIEVVAVATDDTGNQYASDPVTATIAEGSVPVISDARPTTSDLSPSNMLLDAQITLSARVTDADGFIAQVEFFENNSIIGIAEELSEFDVFEIEYTPELIGPVNIRIRATDNSGNVVSIVLPYVVQSTVGTPPVAELLAPDKTDNDNNGVADGLLTRDVQTTLVAEATDSDGTVTSVEFFVNGQSIGNAFDGNGDDVYERIFTPTFAGSMELTVVATDNFGNTASDTQLYSVATGVPPTIQIVSPPGNGTYLPGTSLPVQAVAYDSDGLVQAVEFYLNDQQVGVTGSSPYRVFLDLPAAGPHIFKAIAYDNDGNATTSTEITITGGAPDGDTPIAVMTHPLPLGGGDVVNDASVASETFINVEVNDPDGDPISEVRFYINGEIIASTANPGEVFQVGNVYSTFLDFNATGSYVLFADAVDSDGNTGQAIPIALDVVELLAPMPTVTIRPVLDRSPANEPIQLFVEANGGLIPIDRVDFFANGVLIDSAISPVGAEENLYSINWIPEIPGDYEIKARAVQIDANGLTPDNWRISPVGFDITVTDPATSTPPSVSLLYPEQEQTFTVDSRILLQAGATDPDGTITSVEFYVEDNTVDTPVITGTDASKPYTFEWTPLLPGQYRIIAVANDNSGDYSRSSTTVVNVVSASGGSPTVEIVEPNPIDLDSDGIADSPIKVNTTTRLSIEVSDADHPIDSVTIYSNGNLIGEAVKTAAPGIYELGWRPDLVGAYNIVAVVRDVQLNEAYASLQYEVIDVEAPTVSVFAPEDGAVVTVGNKIAVQALASTPQGSGSIASVEFYQNNTLISVDTTFPYSAEFTPLAEGEVTFVARATNTSGVTSLSTAITVSVAGYGPTGITVDNPVSGTAFLVGRTIPIVTTVTTTGGGSSLLVEFYVNGDLIGQDDTKPFLLNWTPTSPGSYSISAVVTETTNGAQASAEEVTVTINPSAKPIFNSLGPTTITAPTAGSDVQLAADVTDSDGFVESVTFSVNGTELGTATEAPFSIFWRPGSAGMYLIEGRAVDNAGNVTLYSQPVTVNAPIGQPPSVSLSISASGNVTPGSRVVLTASVYDDNPEGVSVTFFMNGAQVSAADDQEPYFAVIEPEIGIGVNAYSVTALASDSDGNSRAIELLPLYISNVAREQPIVWMVTPDSGDTLTEGSRASIRASLVGGAAENVQRVLFYANGVQIGSDATAPYAIDWIPDQIGDVSITAAVLQNTETYDHDFDVDTPLITVTPVTVANPSNVTVNPKVGILPAVSFQILPDQTNIAQGSKVMLYADAQDLDGTVESIEFFRDGVSLGTADTAVPFTQQWIAVQEGEFFINAVAKDNEGNVVNSNFEAVQVSSTVVSPTPTVALTVPSEAQSGDLITLRTSVRDFVTGPESVVFYVNGHRVGEVTSRPYNFVWEANLEGLVSVFATARNTRTNGTIVTTTSDIGLMTLAPDEDPAISNFDYSFPGQSASKTSPLLSEAITFEISVSDNGVIDQVELVRNNEVIQTVTDGTTNLVLTDTPPGLGLYTYSVVVTDNAGRQAQTASAQNLTINVVTGSKPVVSITSPATGSTFTPGDAITVRANASDSDGSVTGVQFYADGAPIGNPDTAVPYQVSYTPPSAGIYILTARATDNSGNFSDISADVSITVVPDNPPIISTFSINLPGNGTTSDPFITRVNQTFTIDVEATDDNLVTALRLFRNSSQLSNPGGVEVPFQYSENLAFSGTFRYRLEAQDSGNNVTSSSTYTVNAIRGSKPLVAIETPQAGIQVSAGAPVAIRATATPAEEPVGPDGSISRVEIYANGSPIASLTNPPYVTSFVPSSEATWIISAVATSDTGVVSDPASITIEAVDGSVPEITSFTNSALNNESFVDVPITFFVEAADESGIDRIELLLEGVTDPVATVSNRPYQLTYTPSASGFNGGVGTFFFSARAVNVDDVATQTDPVSITVSAPDPTEEADDFVFQTIIDMLLRSPTLAEQDEYGNDIDPDIPLDQQIADEALVAKLMTLSEFPGIRAALITRYLMTGQWSNRNQLQSDLNLLIDEAGGRFGSVSTTNEEFAVTALVQTLMPIFEDLYVGSLLSQYGFGGAGITRVPSASSTASEIQAYVSVLWELKYGVSLSANLNTAVTRFRGFGRDRYTALFIMDIGNVTTPGGSSFTPKLGFSNPPNDRMLDWSNAAALIVNFWRTVPTTEQVENLTESLLLDQISTVLSDSRYTSRFQSAMSQLQHRVGGWKWSDWFGWFYPFPGEWNYSTDLGWLYFQIMGQTEASFWYYDPSTGWTWTSADVYPHIYSTADNKWYYIGLFGYTYGQDRWFYSLSENAWVQK